MSAYDMLIKKGVSQGDQQGFERGTVQPTKQFILNLILKFPNLIDAEIAQLANTTIELVKEVRLAK